MTAAPETVAREPNTGLVRVSEHSGIVVVTIVGDIDRHMTPGLRDILMGAVDQHAEVIVDLSGAAAIDRHGLSVLLQSQDRAQTRGSELCFAEPSPTLLAALAELRADAMFPMFDLCSAAATWLRAARVRAGR